jgi:pimeloyl-ACP methyl ester carboxylesterase
MDTSEPQFLEMGEGRKARRIAYRLTPNREPTGVQLLWLPGFLSDMASTKAGVLADWAGARGIPMLRFDYSGHGLSGGALLDATIGDWLHEAQSMLALMPARPTIIIGSSMGGWLALLLARKIVEAGNGARLAGLVLIAPAWDMTEILMWRELLEGARAQIEQTGVIYIPSDYGDPYPITKILIEEGRAHLFEDAPFDPGCPVRILQGMRDADVPWRHALALVDLLEGGDVELTLIKAAGHRQSEPEDLRRLEATVAALAARAAGH